MILFKIYTEDVNRERIERICLDYLLFGTGFTITTGTGYWLGHREKCVVIEVVGREADKDQVLRAASKIKTANKQEVVMVVEAVADNVHYIGKQEKHSGK